MRLLARVLAPKITAHAHCDLPCGVYDPAQARIEAESVKAICERMPALATVCSEDNRLITFDAVSATAILATFVVAATEDRGAMARVSPFHYRFDTNRRKG